jgi:hypothetical protein
MDYKLEDVYRALKFLNLSIDEIEKVKLGFDKAAKQSTFLVQQIVRDLDALDALENTYNQETGTGNFALEKADVLSYSPSQKATGILLQMYGISKRLARNIGVEPDLLVIEQTLRALGVKGLVPPAVTGRIIR